MSKNRTLPFRSKAAATSASVPPRKALLEVVVGAAESLFELSIATGQQVVQALLEDDRLALCGPKGKHDASRTATRHGHDDAVVVLGGRKVAIKKPRVRALDGSELRLPTYEQLSCEDPLLDRVYEQMILGVSTRKYERSLERLPDELQSKSTSKSEVSRNFITQTQAQLSAFLGRPLDQLDVAVVMIDGVYVGKHVLLTALGIDRDGRKHVLGLWEGTTEQEETCRGLLRSLIERGLTVERPRLFVIDGARGLRKAIVKVFGAWAVIARCRQHKVSNILGHLPESKKQWVRAALKKAYESATDAKAKARLHQLADSLRDSYPSAANSIEEGLDDTLTVLRLGVGPTLAKTLRTTNAIENLNGAFRDVTRRVKRWRGGNMALRWGASALLEAEKRFHRVRGYQEIPGLLNALADECQKNGAKKLDTRASNV